MNKIQLLHQLVSIVAGIISIVVGVIAISSKIKMGEADRAEKIAKRDWERQEHESSNV